MTIPAIHHGRAPRLTVELMVEYAGRMRKTDWHYIIAVIGVFAVVAALSIIAAVNHTGRKVLTVPSSNYSVALGTTGLPHIQQHDDDLFPDEPKATPHAQISVDPLAPPKQETPTPLPKPKPTKSKTHSTGNSHTFGGGGHSSNHAPPSQNPTSQPFAPPFSAGFGAFA